MASTIRHHDPLHSRHFNEDKFPEWKACFPREIRRELIEEDLLAGRSVCGVLITIVTCGLVLGIIAVTLALGVD
jgi:hypothetical protein